jgi:hypothetical protein
LVLVTLRLESQVMCLTLPAMTQQLLLLQVLLLLGVEPLRPHRRGLLPLQTCVREAIAQGGWACAAEGARDRATVRPLLPLVLAVALLALERPCVICHGHGAPSPLL